MEESSSIGGLPSSIFLRWYGRDFRMSTETFNRYKIKIRMLGWKLGNFSTRIGDKPLAETYKLLVLRNSFSPITALKPAFSFPLISIRE